MYLLNNSSLSDQLIIRKTSIKVLFVILIIGGFLTLFLFFYQKDYYYTNTLSIINDEIALLVSKDRINEINKENKIIIDDIENNYSIKKINYMDDFLMVYIKLKIKLENIHKKEYKIYLGKEKIIDYIIRIIKNKWKD